MDAISNHEQWNWYFYAKIPFKFQPESLVPESKIQIGNQEVGLKLSSKYIIGHLKHQNDSQFLK